MAKNQTPSLFFHEFLTVAAAIFLHVVSGPEEGVVLTSAPTHG